MRRIVALVALSCLALAGGAAAHGNNGKGHQAVSLAAGGIAVDQARSDLVFQGVAAFTVVVGDVPTGGSPAVDVRCYQDGSQVYGWLLEDMNGLVPLGTGEYPGLGIEGNSLGVSSDWNGGAASCVAELKIYYYNGVGIVQSWETTGASVTFEVTDGSG